MRTALIITIAFAIGCNDIVTSEHHTYDAGGDLDSDSLDNADSDSGDDSDSDTNEDDPGPCSEGYYYESSHVMTPEDLEELRDYTEITWLTIDCPLCTTLEPLHCLVSADEELVLGNYGGEFSNGVLDSLDGLDNLQMVGELIISGMDGLENIEALGSLTSFGDSVKISHNASLVDLRGLEGLSELEELIIDDNAALESLEGLNNLAVVSDTITVTSNPTLADLDGLAYLSDLAYGENTFTDNDSLPYCEICDFLSHIDYVPEMSFFFGNLEDECCTGDCIGADYLTCP